MRRAPLQLVVPYLTEVDGADSRLMGLAGFLGIACQKLPLDRQTRHYAEYIHKVIPNRTSCLVLNPRVIRDWTAGVLPGELARCFTSHFRYVLVHSLIPDPFVDRLIASLSAGGLESVRRVADLGSCYEISSTSRDVCGAFSGLSFGPINAANDGVLSVNAAGNTLRSLICIGGRPLMAALKCDASEMLFVASEDVADVNAHIGYSPLDNHFSRLMPQAMALRYIFGEECWRPGQPSATIIVDDPLLRPNYGFLNYESLFRLTTEYKFHTAIAFIPHNYRRNSKCILNLFRHNPNYLSLCYHGNDHTRSEFASRDIDFLNSALAIAEQRMRLHHQSTGLRCDKVMVFPGSDFSAEAMQILKSRNFYAAVSSAWHPLGQPSLPSVSDICQPANLRFGGFPLFGRNAARDVRSQDVAFNLFFGKPTLTGEHHDTFEDPHDLVQAVQRINAVAPGILWSNLETAVGGSHLRRRAADGTVHIRAYCPSVEIVNDAESVERFRITWSQPGQSVPFQQVLRDGASFSTLEESDAGICAAGEVAPGNAHRFSLLYRNGHPPARSLGLRWDSKAFLRRRFSEIRDNYFSKNQYVLGLAKSVQHRLWN